MVNPNTGSSKFQINELPAEVAKAIQGLKEGEYSKPFMMIDEQKGKETYRMVMLKRRYEPHKASMREDYSMLQTMMEDRKRKDVVDEWITKRIQELYVNISPEWQNCEFQYEGWVH